MSVYAYGDPDFVGCYEDNADRIMEFQLKDDLMSKEVTLYVLATQPHATSSAVFLFRQKVFNVANTVHLVPFLVFLMRVRRPVVCYQL